MSFYNGNKVLNLRDRTGKKATIVIVDGNRSSGKTTYMSKWLLNKFKKESSKFLLLYRYVYELSNVADKFFKCLSQIGYAGEFTSESQAQGRYHKLYYNDKNCGYACAINSAEAIKKQSHEFSDIDYILFDEFQSETGQYAQNELQKFLSIYTSVNRGGGAMTRNVRVILLSNSVDINNPYYLALGITDKLLHTGFKFYRGNGFVVEKNFNSDSAEAVESTSFYKAFANTDYLKSATGQGNYLNEQRSLITSCDLSNAKYYCTLKHNNKFFGLYTNSAKMLVTEKSDKNNKLCFTVDKVCIDEVLAPRRLFEQIKILYSVGRIECDSLNAQNLIYDILKL